MLREDGQVVSGFTRNVVSLITYCQLSIYIKFDLNDPFVLQNLVLEKSYFALLGSSSLTFYT